jgi:hypothetical protein
MCRPEIFKLTLTSPASYRVASHREVVSLGRIVTYFAGFINRNLYESRRHHGRLA